jgi:toxin ParE1/3/4
MARVAVEITNAARRDLDQIAAYLEQEAGKRVAGRWVRRLEARILQLADFPHAGAEDDQLGVGRRRLVERPYLIVYRILAPNLVRVVRVVHGARDLPSLFKDAVDPP